MKEKSVCFVNTNRAWGGGEKWHFTTCQTLKKEGFNAFLVTNLNSQLFDKANKAGLGTIGLRISNLSFINPLKILLLVALFKVRKVESVIMNLPSDLKVAGIAAKIAGVKNIIYRRGMPHPLRNTWLNRFLFQKVLTHVVVNSAEIGKSLANDNKEWFPADKMVLIYNGVDTHIPLFPRPALYQRNGDEYVIGNVGRLTDQKGQTYLLEMVKKLKDQGMQIKLLIAGEGELREELLKIVTAYGIQNEVKFMGHIEDINGFMSSIDVFVFSSKYEGSANTLIETLYYEKPIVAFDVSSNPEIVVNNETGFLAKAFDVDDLTHKVQFLLKDKALQDKFVGNGVKLLKEKFDSGRNLGVLRRIVS